MSEKSSKANLEGLEKLDFRVDRGIDVQPFREERHFTHNLMAEVLINGNNCGSIRDEAFPLNAVVLCLTKDFKESKI
ncbi:MAG: hypothetical protein FJ267_06165 [Planctomycetes bacterium]|nr:hypothetical protein [Planctomycetota bacterium]